MLTFNKKLFTNLKYNLPSSIVVFLIAIPLGLGIASFSGAPLFSGIISALVGAFVVGYFSESQLNISGPSIGLILISFVAITTLGSFQLFLLSVVIAGIIQLISSYFKTDIIANYFPSSVIHGVLIGIGGLVILKQIPYALGYNNIAENFKQANNQNIVSEFFTTINSINTSVVFITLVSVFILIIWQTDTFKNHKVTSKIPAPLVAVFSGIALNFGFSKFPALAISNEHLVNLPTISNSNDFFSNFSFPDLNGLTNPKVYTSAIIITIVASIETLLTTKVNSIQNNNNSTESLNKELKAQGIGNIISGLIGGLPLTQNIIKSAANQQTGGKTKIALFLYGILLLTTVILIPNILNLIPLATLSIILVFVGYKLIKPAIFKKMYKGGMEQFIPFIITVIGILFTNLITGVLLGTATAVLLTLKQNYKAPFKISIDHKNTTIIVFSEGVTFLNKASLLQILNKIPHRSCVKIDTRNAHFISQDIIELIEDYRDCAISKNIYLEIIESHKRKQELFVLPFTIINNKK